MAATEFEELLISYVQEKEFLYDKTNVQYKNVRIKENAWCTIADILNSDGKLAILQHFSSDFVKLYISFHFILYVDIIYLCSYKMHTLNV